MDVDREILNEIVITVPGPDPNHWICVNSKRSVPYRDRKRWILIVKYF